MNIQEMQKLRQETGAGLLDCRNAWTEAGGDMDRAIALLHEKGMAIARKKAERVAADGIAFAKVYAGCAVLLEVNSETDFVAGNEAFVVSVERIADTIALHQPADVVALSACRTSDQDLTIGELLQRMILMFRENLVIRRFEIVTGDRLFAYMHQNGRIGVVLSLSVSETIDPDLIVRIGQELTLQIAAMNPQYVSIQSMDQETLSTIRRDIVAEVNEDVALKSKPESVRERIVAGRFEKYLSTHCLMEQPSIREESRSVREQIRSILDSESRDIVVTAFHRFEKGEGLEVETAYCPLFGRQVVI